MDLRQAKNIDNLGYNRYAIKVEDIEGTCSELVDRGLSIDGPVYVEATKRKLVTIRDPNGILVQLVEINDRQMDYRKICRGFMLSINPSGTKNKVKCKHNLNYTHQECSPFLRFYTSIE